MRCHWALFAAAQEIDALIDGYTREPGRLLGIAMKGVESVPGFQEGVLKQVVGILMGEDHATNHPIQLFTILVYHLLEGSTLRLRIHHRTETLRTTSPTFTM